MKENKTLIAYFSCTQTTQAAAEKLAALTGADLFEITPEVPYSAADLDWTQPQSRSSLEMKDLTSRPALLNKVTKMENYDTILLGFPIWWYLAPTIIGTFLESDEFSGKTIIPFATSGGSGLGKTAEQLKEYSGSANWKTGKILNGSLSEKALTDWLQSLGLN